MGTHVLYEHAFSCKGYLVEALSTEIGAEALGHVRQLDLVADGVLVEERVHRGEHGRALLGGPHGAVAPREDEVAQAVPVEALDVLERRALDRPEQPALERSRTQRRTLGASLRPITLARASPPTGSRSSRVFQTSASRPPRPQHARDLRKRAPVVEPVEGLRARHDVGRARRRAGSTRRCRAPRSPPAPPRAAARASRGAARPPSRGGRARRAAASACPVPAPRSTTSSGAAP